MSRQTVLISKHAQDITSPCSPSRFKLSSQPVRSTPTGSPVAAWSKKVGEYVKEQELNRRNALREARYSSSSPYYKGLTDFSLDINREKLLGLNPVRESNVASLISPYYKGLIDYSLVINKERLSMSSPGRENQEGSISSGSRSSFAVKVQEWGSSWFASKRHEKGSSSSNKSCHEDRASKTTEDAAVATKVKDKKFNYSECERRNVTVVGLKSEDTLASEKPLRERDSETLPILPVLELSSPPSESFPNTLEQIIQPTAQTFTSPLPTPISESPTSPMAVQKPEQQNPSAGGVAYENKEENTDGNEGKFIWADKYRPLRLQDFLCNRKVALELEAVVRNFHETGEGCGHFIFEGNPGVGKRTMIGAFLREAFGPDKVQAREECREFHLKGEAVESILINLLVSSQHTEVNFSELKGYAKHVIFELINEKNQKLSDEVSQCNPEKFRVIILHEADKLTTDALSYVKWMLEKFKGCNKVFFCCSDASKLESIKPLCRFIQLLEPNNDEILEVLGSIAKNEGIALDQQLADKITGNSRNNLRQAIRSFEATWKLKSSLKGAQLIRTGWEETIAHIAGNAIKEQSPKQLYKIRQELQVLIGHSVAPDFVFQALTEELKLILPEQLLPQFDRLCNDCKKNHAATKNLAPTHQLEESGKGLNGPRQNVIEFMRVEEFMARFMSWYKASI